MAEFLLEILCEEIPARMQGQATEELKKMLADELLARGLSYSDIKTFVTPRRLASIIVGLQEATSATFEERRGPKLNAPEAAIQGFLRSSGIRIEECGQREGYYYARLEIQARPTRDILPEVVQSIFANMSWPKSMVWALEGGDKSQSWVRPVRSVLAVLGGQELSFPLPSLGLVTSNRTQGHRFLAPDGIKVSSFADYREKLANAFVVLDHQERQSLIWEGLQALARAQGLSVQPDERLLQEVAGLVEYPVPFLGQIDPKFMDLPAPVLSTSMRVHQKYFTLVDGQGNIAPWFGVVANKPGKDRGRAMIAGYERVLQARLNDAAFFYELDKKIPLETLVPRLDDIVFHAKLGTVGQKVKRLVKLSGANDMLKRAALLAKADLMTNMVKEFPELQGIMGGIYAQVQGESNEVAQAIREHYLPRGPGDICPDSGLSAMLALTDKMDTLVGFFGIGEGPTGSRDPFALRRAALGIIRIMRENEWTTPYQIKENYEEIYKAYLEQGIVLKLDMDTCVAAVRDFILDRLIVMLRGEGIRHDYVTAVIEGIKATPAKIQQESFIDLYNVWAVAERAKSLQNFMETEDGQSLLTLFRRAWGILKDEQYKDNCEYSGLNLHEKDFTLNEEIDLWRRIQNFIHYRDSSLILHKFEELMEHLANLSHDVDNFFRLKINDDNPRIRRNRLELLGLLVSQTKFVADFSKIEKL